MAEAVEFVGVPHEGPHGFFWLVDADTFRRVTGAEPDIWYREGNLFRLWPGQAHPPNAIGKRVTVRVTMEPGR